jgi:hypothetical protein
MGTLTHDIFTVLPMGGGGSARLSSWILIRVE